MRAQLVAGAVATGLVLTGTGCGGSTAGEYISRIVQGESAVKVIAVASEESPDIAGIVRARAEDAKGLYETLRDPGTSDAACLTLEWVSDNGVDPNVSTGDVLQFAEGQFDRHAQAEEFVRHLKGVSEFDPESAALATCDVAGAGDG